MLIINGNAAKDSFKVFYFKFVVQKKIQSSDNFQKLEKLSFFDKFGVP